MHCHDPLKEPVSHKAALFTLREGVLPIYVTSLYCRGTLIIIYCLYMPLRVILACNESYHHNFSVPKGSQIRTYYTGVPDVIQVATHYFMDSPLLEFIAVSKNFGW